MTSPLLLFHHWERNVPSSKLKSFSVCHDSQSKANFFIWMLELSKNQTGDVSWEESRQTSPGAGLPSPTPGIRSLLSTRPVTVSLKHHVRIFHEPHPTKTSSHSLTLSTWLSEGLHDHMWGVKIGLKCEPLLGWRYHNWSVPSVQCSDLPAQI